MRVFLVLLLCASLCGCSSNAGADTEHGVNQMPTALRVTVYRLDAQNEPVGTEYAFPWELALEQAILDRFTLDNGIDLAGIDPLTVVRKGSHIYAEIGGLASIYAPDTFSALSLLLVNTLMQLPGVEQVHLMIDGFESQTPVAENSSLRITQAEIASED